MTTNIRSLGLAGAIVLATALLHMYARNNLVSFISLPVALSLIVTYTAQRPIRLLVTIIVISELLTTLPVGIMTLLILTPGVIKSIISVAGDLSLAFFLTLLGSASLQILWLILYEISNLVVAYDKVFSWKIVPMYAFAIIPASAIYAFICVIAYKELMPPPDQSNSLLYNKTY